jgi:hypothetical protein
MIISEQWKAVCFSRESVEQYWILCSSEGLTAICIRRFWGERVEQNWILCSSEGLTALCIWQVLEKESGTELDIVQL